MDTENLLIVVSVLFLLLSGAINYYLAKHRPKYYVITIAATIGIVVYAFGTFDAYIHGVEAQDIIIPGSIIAFGVMYLWAKAKLKVKEKEKDGKLKRPEDLIK